MKPLLEKLTKNTVSICFKSGDKVNNVVIEAVIDKSLIVSCNSEIKVIEIPHIAYVIVKEEATEAMGAILKEGKKKNNNDNSKEEDQKSDGKNNGKDDGKDKGKNDEKSEGKSDRSDGNCKRKDKYNDSGCDRRDNKYSDRKGGNLFGY